MADTGSLSGLGIGSGVLTYDVIDKLKQADEATMITPYKKRLDDVKDKENELSGLITQISLLKTSITDFEDGAIFQKRKADVNGSSVTAKVNDGVAVQTIKMDVQQLAQNDIYQSKGFASQTSIINSTNEDQTLKLSFAGTITNINLEKNATLTDLKDAINNAQIRLALLLENDNQNIDRIIELK